jgi:hypothetical protein
MVQRLQSDIERFGQLLQRVYRFEWIYVFVSIHRLLDGRGFSKEFQERMVFPLTALFFGTGNQTPYVSAAVIARVFLDPELRLFEYNKARLLADVPTMFAFGPLRDIFAKIAKTVVDNGNNRVLTSAPVTKVERRRNVVTVHSPALDNGAEEFDDIVFCCGAEQALKILGDDASWRERLLLKNVKYYNDLIITHEDEQYMAQEYEFDRDEDMYMIRCDEKDPKLIEMSFNLARYVAVPLSMPIVQCPVPPALRQHRTNRYSLCSLPCNHSYKQLSAPSQGEGYKPQHLPIDLPRR